MEPTTAAMEPMNFPQRVVGSFIINYSETEYRIRKFKLATIIFCLYHKKREAEMQQRHTIVSISKC